MLSWEQIQSNAVAFSKNWKTKDGRERQQAQTFIREFLAVFGVDDPLQNGEGEFEYVIKGNYIDYLWKKQIAIEMKGKGKDNDLKKAFTQTREKYIPHLSDEEFPDLWMLCDFENIHITRHSTKEAFKFKTSDLRKYIKKFANIAGYSADNVRADRLELNIKAAEKMAKLHDALRTHGYEGHELEVYLVRLLFCMFAGDTGIFTQGSFYYYIKESKEDGSDLSERISKLFELLNMPDDVRKKRTLIPQKLKDDFKYINGGLFSENLPSAEFNPKMRKLLLECREFDWSEISPAIFGAMFQGVMKPEQRRELGAHYTSEENILKLINPLFMDELRSEFERVKTDSNALDRFHNKIARLKFLDPACGCGNFLIITYRELRLLELEIVKMKQDTFQLKLFDISDMLKVSITQFYGIEYEDFPCQIAQAGMWLVDHQMNLLASELIGQYYARLPLTESATIVHGNALRLDWEEIVPKDELSYILGNPPFIGYSNQSAEQKADILSVYIDKSGKPFKTAGKIDYVAAWYYKAAQYLVGTSICAAFVSTNSITQGEQVSAVFRPLFEMFGIHIDFAYRTFKWGNEAKGKAAVHCVIIGFSTMHGRDKIIYDSEEKITAKNINPYLINGENIFVESRRKPISNVPEMITGNRPADGGHLIIENEDLEDFIKADPLSEKYIKQFMGASEFINNKKRWCLWLVGVPASELRKMPEVMKRITACKQDRENAPDEGRRKLAATPTLFRETNTPETFIAVPVVSSENRNYIPIGFMTPKIILSDRVKMIPNATLLHFGILTSSVHMAWVRTVCGRLKSDYNYSKDIVYNNFPWVDATDEQKSVIEGLSQAVLDARALFLDCSLADLYDPLTMPPKLLKAHKVLDKAVMGLYNFDKGMTEAEVVAGLMERYRGLVGE